MSLSSAIREQVRQRAHCACEFYGISEIDAGGLLTIDHFQPRSKNGTDDVENLIYACASCNQYKHGYWAMESTAPTLWNPRQESADQHFIEQADGQLTALTPTGVFTIKRLRLKSQSIGHRSPKTQSTTTSGTDSPTLSITHNIAITNYASTHPSCH
jgi:hypothetical protein